jgi:hypothetical protein
MTETVPIKRGAGVAEEEFIFRFEAGAIAADSFHHLDHIHLAFAYLRAYPVLAALHRFSSALKDFAAAQCKPERYNETITYAYFFLIQERMARCRTIQWEEFLCQNADLLVSKDGILERYYQGSTLKSDLARQVFVFPDKCGGD